MEASSSRLPSYTPPTKDAICFIPSLSALHPDPTHPAHTALLSNIDLKKESVKIFSFSQGGIIVCPEEVGVGEEESWAKAGGYLQVVSTQRRIAQNISVKIVALQSLAFPTDRGRREDEDGEEVFSKEVVLKEVQLEKGLNTFEWLLTIPHSAPTHAARTRNPKSFARVFQKAIGTVSGSKGLFGTKDLTAEERIWIVAAPSPETFTESLRLDIAAEGHTDQLGPVSLKVSSSTFVVAGPLFLSLTLHYPPPDLRVYALKCYIEQKADLTSFRFPTKTAQILYEGMVLETGWKGPYGAKSLSQMLADGRVMKEMLFDASDGGEWTFEQVARIADSTVLRASTHPNTDTRLRFSSELVVDLYFTSASSDSTAPPTKVLIATLLRRPVFLAECACLPERLSLPDYTPKSQDFVPIIVRIPCKYHESTETLLKDEMKLVQASRAAEMASNETDRDSRDRDALLPSGSKIGEAY